MSIGSLVAPAGSSLGGRLAAVTYLPTVASLLFVLLLLWAGAPGPRLDFTAAWKTANALSVTQALLLGLAVTLLTVIAHPFQIPLVRFLEGAWPSWLRWLGAWRSARHAKKRSVLAAATIAVGDPPNAAATNRAGWAQAELDSRYPPNSLPVERTVLGNVLAASEFRAGSGYGLDAVSAWPRLYPVLPDATRTVLESSRNALDAAARLSVTAFVTALVCAGLLAKSGWWALLIIAPATIAWLAYWAAVHAARNYGVAVCAAFDLHRFDMYRALNLSLPVDLVAEKTFNEELCTHWRQGTPHPYVRYEPPPGSTTEPTAGQPSPPA
ncbi:hypothetical protein [Nocardia sp. NPDC059195]|uniref:hypothetical protein n=1 Tax=Nocardia sp. NPDC059195 TaxID=3346765 RepID=UPI00368BD849